MPAVLSPLTAVDGDNLAVYDWPLALGVPRAVVVLVHGLGEHMGRYNRLAGQLNAWGFAVRGYDQVGHGESGGQRGDLPAPNRLFDDLADVVDNTLLQYTSRHRVPPPLLLLGHSMGGLVAAQFVARRLRPVAGLVLSSPAFDPGLSAFQRWLLAVVPRVAPGLRVANGLKLQYLARDARVVEAYRNDSRVHNRIGVRLAQFIADTGPATLAAAPHWNVPTLLLYAGADKLVNPAGSRAFAAAAPPGVLQAHCFEQHFHEIFNDPDRAPVLGALQEWLSSRFPARSE